MANIKITDLNNINVDKISSSIFLVSHIESNNTKTSNKLEYSALCTLIIQDIKTTTTNSIVEDVNIINTSTIPTLSNIINNLITSINADITSINADITSINADITSINADITSINADITSTTANITTINADITTINTDINTISGDVSEISTSLGTLSNVTIPEITEDINMLLISADDFDDREATSDRLGMIKLFSSADNMPEVDDNNEMAISVSLDSSNNAYVVIPKNSGTGTGTIPQQVGERLNTVETKVSLLETFTGKEKIALDGCYQLVKGLEHIVKAEDDNTLSNCYDPYFIGAIESISVSNYPFNYTGSITDTTQESLTNETLAKKEAPTLTVTYELIGYAGILYELIRYVGQTSCWPTTNTPIEYEEVYTPSTESPPTE